MKEEDSLSNNYTKETTQKVYRVLIANDLKKRSKNTKCYYGSCECDPINSHSIQEALLNETIGKSGCVYMCNIQSVAKNIIKGIIEDFTPVPITQSGVFPGFCGDDGKSHDSNLFKLIEIEDEINKSTIEKYVFLYAYRALVYQMWLKSTLGKPISDLTEAKINPVVDEYVMKTIGDLASLYIESPESLKQFNSLKSQFEEHINGDGGINGNIFDSFNINYIELNEWELEFAGIGARYFSGSQYPICYGLIPKQQNKPNLFFWVSAKKDNFSHQFFKAVVDEGRVNTIKNLVALSGNMMLSENLFKHLASSNTLDNLVAFIAPDEIGKSYDQYDLIREQGFQLFRNFLY